MVRFGAISAVGTIAVLMLVRITLAENWKGGPSAQPSLPPAPSMRNGLVLGRLHSCEGLQLSTLRSKLGAWKTTSKKYSLG